MEQPTWHQLLEEQTAYYRARATTYDLDMAWDSDDPELRELLAPVEGWFAALPIRGRVLELACGTEHGSGDSPPGGTTSMRST